MPDARPFLTLDDGNWQGKTVLVRADLNCPYDPATGKIEDSERLTAHAETIRELSQAGARVVIMAHQGRAGDDDFINLEQHAERLSKHVKRVVKFVPDVIGPEAQAKIKTLTDGKILLLDNVRLLAEETLELTPEEHAKSRFVQALAPLAQAFVLDGFSVSHRAHASVVGFTTVLPSYAGRVLQREWDGVSKAADQAKHPNVHILAGAKPDDVFKLLKHGCASPHVDLLLTSGVIGNLCLMAKGVDLGPGSTQLIKENAWDKFLPQIKELVAKYPEKIEIPTDLAIERDGRRVEIPVTSLPVPEATLDIGSKTAKTYADLVRTAGSVYVKGPVGVYEKPAFELGTKTVFEAVVNGKAFSLMGGGHTVSAVEKFKLDQRKIGYISLAGGALLTYLTGEKLPGLQALAAAKNKTAR